MIDTNKAKSIIAAFGRSLPSFGGILQIPLHFNLYNEVYQLPNWLAANHYPNHYEGEQDHDMQEHQANSLLRNGGPHPDNPRNFVEIDLGP